MSSRIEEKYTPEKNRAIPLVSVIIPVFNSDISIGNCINSVISQTFSDIEILCVDDGSSDRSVAAIESFMKSDARVKLIRHDKNMGPGGARNTGIAAAQAPYIASVDSDDTMQPRMLEVLVSAIERGKYDIVCCGFRVVSPNGSHISTIKFNNSNIHIDGNTDILNVVNPAFWNKIWRRSLFTENSISFPEEVYFQDANTTPRLVFAAKKIKLIDDVLYNYTRRPDGITQRFTKKHIHDYHYLFESWRDFLKKNNLWDKNRDIFYNTISVHLDSHAANVMNALNDEEEKREHMRRLSMLKAGYIIGDQGIKNISCDGILERFLALADSKRLADLEKQVAAIPTLEEQRGCLLVALEEQRVALEEQRVALEEQCGHLRVALEEQRVALEEQCGHLRVALEEQRGRLRVDGQRVIVDGQSYVRDGTTAAAINRRLSALAARYPRLARIFVRLLRSAWQAGRAVAVGEDRQPRQKSDVLIFVREGDERGERLLAANGNLNPSSLALWQHLLQQPENWTHVVDVGANYGEMLVHGGLPPEGTVIAMEPNPAIAACLRRTLAAAGVNANVIEAAAADHDGEAVLLIDTVWSGTSRLATVGTAADAAEAQRLQPLRTPCRTLDQVLWEAGAGSESRVLVKIDVEGAERAVLSGTMAAADTTRTWRAIVEVLHMSDADFDWMCSGFRVWGWGLKRPGLQSVTSAAEFRQLVAEGVCYPQDVAIERMRVGVF